MTRGKKADPTVRPQVVTDQDDPVLVKDLEFDRHNPRMPDSKFDSDDDYVRHLVDDFDVDELVQSILSSGWIDYEPLIVEAKTNVVYEGNRRLAALKLIADPKLRRSIGYKLPEIPRPQSPPERVRVRYVKDRIAARHFVAWKHITGPYKWDAYAKARYAADWLEAGESIEAIARMLGDSHNTIRRLVSGIHILAQAQSIGFDIEDRTKRRFAFSHLYTAVSRPAVQDFLGIANNDEDLRPNPVPRDNIEHLQLLVSWLYGQESKKEPSLIESQNPNLNQLVRVIGNSAALRELRKSRRLDKAYEQVEPPSDRFKDALVAATKQCETALGLSAHFDGDLTILEIGKNLAATVRNLRDGMIKKAVSADSEDL